MRSVKKQITYPPQGVTKMPCLARVMLLLVVFTAGCATTSITPDKLRKTSGGEAALDHWRQSVDLVNSFLSSPFRLSLPKGVLTLEEDQGMVFTGAGGSAVRIELRADSKFLDST